jgi:Domain of unknown function (DUF4349)
MTPSRLALAAILSLALVAPLAGCKADADAGAAPAPAAAAPAATPPGKSLADLQLQKRKVIKNAELSLQVPSPSGAAREAGKIAERHGGYLASSDADQSRAEDGSEPSSVRVTIRVNADQLDIALDELRHLSNHVGAEKITTEDVTDEWVDLEARLATQKKLEQQYLKILERADKVDDLLSTEKQLAEVRGEIEKMEGRKRHLGDLVALSTVTLRFEQERPLVAVSASAFGRAIKRASADAVSVGANIVIGSIRIAGVLLPVLLLVLLPALLVLRFALRRASKPARA